MDTHIISHLDVSIADAEGENAHPTGLEEFSGGPGITTIAVAVSHQEHGLHCVRPGQRYDALRGEEI